MKSWSYTVNPFDVATENSYVAMRKIGNYTLNAVNKTPANVFMHDRYTVLSPFVSDYITNFDKWRNNKALNKGQSSNLTDLLLTLRSEKIREWDIQIQVKHAHSTPEYISLLPNYRKPFQTGTQLDRMSSVNTLGIGLIDDLSLVDLKIDVDLFYTQLKTAHNLLLAGKSDVGIGSDSLETSRLNLAVELYSTLGLMIDHFKKTPINITNFFDLETIRNHEQTTFRSKVAGGETVLAMKHTYVADEEFIFINRGKTHFRVALVANQATPVGTLFIEIPPITNMTIKAQDIGDIATCKFLKVQNIDTNLAGAYTIELL